MDPLRAPPARWRARRELAGEGRQSSISNRGGLGVSYDAPRPGAAEYAGAVLPILRASGLAIVLNQAGTSWRLPVSADASRGRQRRGKREAGSGKQAFRVMDAGMTE